MLLVITIAACTLILGWQVHRYDLKDREPVPALLLASAFGAIGMWLASLVHATLIRGLGQFATDHWTASMSVIAGVTEELAKLASVIMVIGLRHRWFKDPIDGLIYGAFAGIGAGLFESIGTLWGHQSQFLPASEPVRLVGHLTMGGIAAYGIAYLKLGRRSWPSRLASGLFAAITLHIAWDLVAFDAAARGAMSGWHTAASMMLMLGGMVIFRGMIRLAAGEKRGSGGRRGFALDLDDGFVERRAASPMCAQRASP